MYDILCFFGDTNLHLPPITSESGIDVTLGTHLLINDTGFSLIHTETNTTEYTLLISEHVYIRDYFLKISKITRLSHTSWKGEVVCDKWIHIIDRIFIIEHKLTHN